MNNVKNFLMIKKVIVTGGCGFIGSHLVKLLLKKNFFVINIDKMAYSANYYNLKKIENKKNYRFFKININNQKSIIKILNKYKPEGLFNLAAETHVDRSIDNPENFITSNILGVYNLLESIRYYLKKNKLNFKMIHISTDEVYGDIKKNKKSKEDDPYKPSSPYSASKASADHLINSYIRTFKMPIIISKCCNNYGPNQFPEKIIPKIILNIKKNKILPIYAKGKNIREWIYVNDHCRALLELFKNGVVGESYNVGSGLILNNLKLTNIILKQYKIHFGKPGKKVKIKFVKDRPGHDFRYTLNFSKIMKKTKWRPLVSFPKGITETVKWYINNPGFFKSKNK